MGRTSRTRTIAESQGNGDFSFSDSQSGFCSAVGIAGDEILAHSWHTLLFDGYGFSVELRCSVSLPRSAFVDTYPGFLVQSELDERFALFSPVEFYIGSVP